MVSPLPPTTSTVKFSGLISWLTEKREPAPTRFATPARRPTLTDMFTLQGASDHAGRTKIQTVHLKPGVPLTVENLEHTLPEGVPLIIGRKFMGVDMGVPQALFFGNALERFLPKYQDCALISRMHGYLIKISGRIHYVDGVPLPRGHRSSPGESFINGHRILSRQPFVIHSGDRIGLGADFIALQIG